MSANLSLIGSKGSVYNPNGSVSFRGSAEPNSFATLVTRSVSPLGLAGDVVFRRLYLTVDHSTGVELAVVPVVDGERITENVRYFSRPVPPMAGKRERHTFMVPLGISMANRPGNSGLRGTTIQLEISSHRPNGDWFLENVDIVFASGSRARRED